MDTTIIAAIIGALAAVVAAWLGIRRQVTRKKDLSIAVHRQIFDTLYQVRKYFATICHYLVEVDPGPTFATDIHTALCSFRDACDTLQSQVGSNRALIGATNYDRLRELVNAASDLIETMKLDMSGKIPAPQTQKELSEHLRHFGKTLTDAEEIIKEWRRL